MSIFFSKNEYRIELSHSEPHHSRRASMGITPNFSRGRRHFTKSFDSSSLKLCLETPMTESPFRAKEIERQAFTAKNSQRFHSRRGSAQSDGRELAQYFKTESSAPKSVNNESLQDKFSRLLGEEAIKKDISHKNENYSNRLLADSKRGNEHLQKGIEVRQMQKEKMRLQDTMVALRNGLNFESYRKNPRLEAQYNEHRRILANQYKEILKRKENKKAEDRMRNEEIENLAVKLNEEVSQRKSEVKKTMQDQFFQSLSERKWKIELELEQKAKEKEAKKREEEKAKEEYNIQKMHEKMLQGSYKKSIEEQIRYEKQRREEEKQNYKANGWDPKAMQTKFNPQAKFIPTTHEITMENYRLIEQKEIQNAKRQQEERNEEQQYLERLHQLELEEQKQQIEKRNKLKEERDFDKSLKEYSAKKERQLMEQEKRKHTEQYNQAQSEIQESLAKESIHSSEMKRKYNEELQSLIMTRNKVRSAQKEKELRDEGLGLKLDSYQPNSRLQRQYKEHKEIVEKQLWESQLKNYPNKDESTEVFEQMEKLSRKLNKEKELAESKKREEMKQQYLNSLASSAKKRRDIQEQHLQEQKLFNKELREIEREAQTEKLSKQEQKMAYRKHLENQIKEESERRNQERKERREWMDVRSRQLLFEMKQKAEEIDQMINSMKLPSKA